MPTGPIWVLNPFRLPRGEKLQNALCEIDTIEVQVITEDAISQRPELPPELIFVLFPDHRREDETGILEKFLGQLPGIPLIAVGGFASGYCDCPVLKKYVWGIIRTPISQIDLRLHLWKYLPLRSGAVGKVRREIRQEFGFDLLVGKSPRVLELKEQIAQIAPYEATVLVRGETGTGKELTAKMLHFLSLRAGKPFVPVNCGGIPEELFENELFGHRKGAYTHASEHQSGLVGSAEGGTLFFDEIESMPLAVQVKLLRFLEEKTYKPLGQAGYVPADVRVVAAAKVDLADLVRQRRFREDLFYRLNVLQIHLPPLRERKSDIPLLAMHFLRHYATVYRKEMKGISPPALLSLMHRKWPGNVRELENLIQGAVIRNRSGWLQLADVGGGEVPGFPASPGIPPLKHAKEQVVADFEISYLQNLLETCAGNVSQAARLAQKERSEFCRLLKKYHLDPDEFRSPSQPR